MSARDEIDREMLLPGNVIALAMFRHSQIPMESDIADAVLMALHKMPPADRIALARALVADTPSVVVPAEYVRVTRSPDKSAIKVAMDQGVVVDGAEWTNAANTLIVRTK